MSDTTYELTDDLKRFIRHEIAAGRFNSAREVIEAGLLLLEERETRLAALRAAIAANDRGAAETAPPQLDPGD
jgi:antitoxin ParD1/3/4